jgi:sortase (surface protein transpeptidase)
MPSVRLIKAIFVITLFAAGVFVWTLIHALFYAPETEAYSPPPAVQDVVRDMSEPAKLDIPSLGIHTNVQRVGMGYTGRMAVPNNYKDVGWYRNGPLPGQKGSAVMDGHVDDGFGRDAVFKHLSDIRIGDDVYIVTQGGSRLHFIVTDVRSYPYATAPTASIFGQADAARLNLITCAGVWIPGSEMYDERLVVYTKLAGNMKEKNT